MFTSSLAAITGTRSALGFKRARKVLVVLVDGLGAENLSARAGHAPWLSQQVTSGQTGLAAFPATTSANIVGLATGLMPGAHGFIGHSVSDRHFGQRINLLNGWHEATNPEIWQPHQTVSEMAYDLGIHFNVIAAEEYRSTGFTSATMRKAQFHGVDDLSERFDRAVELLEASEDSVNYLYIPELDKYGHLNGWQSPGWAMLLETLAAEIDRLRKRLPPGTGLIVTADHGMVDTDDDSRVELSQELDRFGVEFFGGDTRSAFVYLEDSGSVDSVKLELAGNRLFDAHTPHDLVSWYGEFGTQALNRIPDLVLLAKGKNTLYHSRFSKPRSYKMVAHHGTPTSAELRVPLIRVGI